VNICYCTTKVPPNKRPLSLVYRCKNWYDTKAIQIVCARSEVGLSRLPVTEEIAGSNPVGRAKVKISPCVGFLLWQDALVVNQRCSYSIK
jgi:hypothetical protein